MRAFVYPPASQSSKDELENKVAQLHADAVSAKLKSSSLSVEEIIKLIDELNNNSHKK